MTTATITDPARSPDTVQPMVGAGCLRIEISIDWTTMERQGPQYEPFHSRDEIFSNGPILLSQIQELARSKYGPFTRGVAIVSVGCGPNPGGERTACPKGPNDNT